MFRCVYNPLIYSILSVLSNNSTDSIILGACPFCHIRGFRVGRTTVYPGAALALVPATSPARRLWENYVPPLMDDEDSDSSSDDDRKDEAPVTTATNRFDEHVNNVIATKIKRVTDAEALASGRRALKLKTKTAKKAEHFKGVSVYAKLFPGSYNTIHSII